MGAVLRLPVIVQDRLIDVADRLARTNQIVLFAAVADPDAESFESVSRPRRLGLILGDEHEGIEPGLLDRCERAVTIPMRPAPAH